MEERINMIEKEVRHMKIYQEADYAAMSRRAANLISAEIIRKPECILGLATGDTPLGTYQKLIEWNQKGDISFRSVRTFNLDEYLGLAPDDAQSYRHYMDKNLFGHVDIDPANTFLPDGLAADGDAECRRYDALLESLGYADLQLLGLGRNGHIGFNEPGECFIRQSHVVTLSQSTITANARFFADIDDVPRQALTMGMGCIMAARRVLLMVSGEDKAEALYQAVCGPITPYCPASILQLHGDVVIVGDRAALEKLLKAGVEVCGS